MQITKLKLKKIIQEELEAVLAEEYLPEMFYDPNDPEAVLGWEDEGLAQTVINPQIVGTARPGFTAMAQGHEQTPTQRMRRYPKFFGPAGEERSEPGRHEAEASLVGGGIEGTLADVVSGAEQSEPYVDYGAMAAAIDYDRAQRGLAPLAKFDPSAPYNADPRYLGQTHLVGTGIIGKEDYRE